MQAQAELYIPEVAQDEGWGKLGIAMVGMAVLFAAGVAYFIATSGSENGSESSSEVAMVADPGEESPAEPESEPETKVEAIAVDENVGLTAIAEKADAAVVATGTAPGAGIPVVPDPPPVVPDPPPAVPDPPPASPDTTNIEGAIGLLRANGEVDRPAGLISLTIESDPPGAAVVRKRDGVRLGVTPYQYDGESESGKLVFIIEKQGYRSFVVSMPANKDGVRQVVLLPGKSSSAAVSSNVSASKAKPTKKKATRPRAKPRPTKKSRRAPTKRRAPKRQRETKSGGKVDYNAGSVPFD